MDIIRDIKGGVVGGNYMVEPDRREALKRAVGMAKAGDVVLVAGKGHEDYQEIKGVRQRFSDREVTMEIIRERLSKQRAQ